MRKPFLAFLLLTLLLPACQSPSSPAPAAATPTGDTALTPQPTQAHQLEITVAQAQTKTYQPVEFTILTDLVFTNPFDPAEVDLQARLTPPSGQPLLIPAFWYQDFDPGSKAPKGNPGWRVRFTPTMPGEWTAQAILAEPALQSSTIRLQVSDDPAARGFVRVHPLNHNYFAFDNGETFFPVGINMGWGGEQPLADYERWMDALAAQGGTIIRIWMASWSFGIEWNDTGLGNYTPRLERAWQLDQVMRMAEERGIKVVLVLLNHGAFSDSVNPEWENNPFNILNGGMLEKPEEFVTNPEARQFFQRRLRYIAARWAYSPSLMAWEWWNEEDLTPITSQALIPWIQEMTPILRSHDPYRHLITTSFARSSVPEVTNLPEIDFAQVHRYDAADPTFAFVYLYDQWRAQVPGKPILFGEFGNSAGLEDTQSPDRQGLHLHNSLWASTFAGYASSAMYWWWDSYVDPLTLWPVYNRLTRFLAGEDLAAYQPVKAFISPQNFPYRILASGDRQLIWLHDRNYETGALQAALNQIQKDGKTPEPGWQYLPEAISGLTLTLENLPDGSYTIYWYSPNRGEWLEQQAVAMENGQGVTPIPPFWGDLAAKVLPAKAPPPN